MPRPLLKLLGTGIGLAAEYNADRKARKAAERSPSPNPPRSPSPNPERRDNPDADDSSDLDEESWELDELQQDIAPVRGSSTNSAAPPDPSTGEDGRDVDEVVSAFFKKHPNPPPYTPTAGQLPVPVILPQRRPQQNIRGFVRAYAPVLQTCDIDQDIWMDFLNGFHKAIKMSPYFHATNAAIGVGALTVQAVAGASILTQMAAIAIHISVETSRRGYTRYQTNKYLDTMNDRLFKPRGLYAMVMTYKPSSSSADEVVDLTSSLTKAVGVRHDGKGRKFTSSSGKTRGELELPEVAKLVFPGLDAASAERTAEGKQKSHFLSDYMDRRAQARFAAEHPDSRLNVVRKQGFASRYGDPNRPVNTGDLVSFVSGGYLQRRRSGRRGRNSAMRGQQQQQGVGSAQGPLRLIDGLKKQLKENVLYLIVVNLPSEEEIRVARESFKER